LFTVISNELNLVLPWGHGINPVNREVTVRHGSRAVYVADEIIEKQVALAIRDQHADGNGVVKDIWDAHAEYTVNNQFTGATRIVVIDIRPIPGTRAMIRWDTRIGNKLPPDADTHCDQHNEERKNRHFFHSSFSWVRGSKIKGKWN